MNNSYTCRVSICIPTYNQVAFLKRLLNSIFEQSFNDYEIIVTDDSNNNDISNYLIENDLLKSIKYFKNDPQLGPAKNWNYATSLATGEFIKIMHHDDWFSSKLALSKFVQSLDESPNVSFSFSNITNVNAVNGKMKKHKLTNKDWLLFNRYPEYIFTNNFIGPPSTVIYRNKTIFEFNSNYNYVVDIQFYLQLIKKGSAKHIDDFLVFGTVESEYQLTRKCEDSPSTLISEYFNLYEEISADLSPQIRKSCLNLLVRILARFKISSIPEIRLYGYCGPIPKYIISYMRLIKISPFLTKVVTKFL